MSSKEILLDLYSQLKPIEGELRHKISSVYSSNRKLSSLEILLSFEKTEFLNIFYDYHRVLDKPQVLVEFRDLYYSDIYTIKDIENKEFEFDKKEFIHDLMEGNAIYFSVSKIKFGKIIKGEIDFEMEFALTNRGDDCVFGDTFEEHDKYRRIMKHKLNVCELFFETSKTENIYEYLRFIDLNVYDISKIEKTNKPIYYYGKDILYKIPFVTDANCSKYEDVNYKLLPPPFDKTNINRIFDCIKKLDADSLDKIYVEKIPQDIEPLLADFRKKIEKFIELGDTELNLEKGECFGCKFHGYSYIFTGNNSGKKAAFAFDYEENLIAGMKGCSWFAPIGSEKKIEGAFCI